MIIRSKVAMEVNSIHLINNKTVLVDGCYYSAASDLYIISLIIE